MLLLRLYDVLFMVVGIFMVECNLLWFVCPSYVSISNGFLDTFFDPFIFETKHLCSVFISKNCNSQALHPFEYQRKVSIKIVFVVCMVSTTHCNIINNNISRIVAKCWIKRMVTIHSRKCLLLKRYVWCYTSVHPFIQNINTH